MPPRRPSRQLHVDYTFDAKRQRWTLAAFHLSTWKEFLPGRPFPASPGPYHPWDLWMGKLELEDDRGFQLHLPPRLRLPWPPCLLQGVQGLSFCFLLVSRCLWL